MLSEELAKKLHDKFTRKQSLLPEEKAMLEEWYASQDMAESEMLGVPTDNDDSNAATLERQIDSALGQLTTVTTRIQQISAENEALKREIALLRNQLTHQTPTIQVAA